MEANNYDNDFIRPNSSTSAKDIQGKAAVIARTFVKDAGTALEQNPALIVGVVAGVGLVVAGALFFGLRRRPTLIDRVLDLF